MKKRQDIGQILLTILLAVLACGIIIPFLLILGVSFSNEEDIILNGYKLIPEHFDLSGYRYVLQNPAQILQAYKITIIFSVVGTAITVLFTALIAYPLSRKDMVGRDIINTMLLITMLFGGGLVPTYILNTRYLHLNNTIWIYIIPGMLSAWNVFMMRTFFSQLPDGIVEAAMIDGASQLRIFFTIIIPLEKHKELNHEIVFAGGIHTWVGLGVHNKLSFDSMIPALELCRENEIKKVFATVWGDNGAEVPFYTVLPGLQLFAEYNYYDNAKHLAKRFKQCTGMEIEAFLALELDDLDEEKRIVPWISTSKQVLYNDPLMGLFDKCFENEDMYGIYKKKLERINKVNVPSGMELLFDYYKRLIEVLMLKSKLTKDMLSAYDDKDMSALKKCASDFGDLSEKVRETYNVYVKQWELMNKPFGMEIIDLRFGGLITRLNTASRRLNEFCDGKLAVLEELEEKRLYYAKGGVVTSLEKPFVNNHAHLNIITASTV